MSISGQMDRPSLASLPAAIGTAVLLCGAICTGLIFVALLPVLPQIADTFGGGVQGKLFAQSVMTMPAIGLIGGGLAALWLIERVRPVHLLALALTGCAITGTAGLYLDAPSGLLASRLALGFASAVASITTTALIARNFGEERRARMLGYKGAVTSISSVAGLLAAGWLGDVGGWRLPFALYLFPLFLAVLALLTLRDAPHSTAPRQSSAQQSLKPLWPIYGTVVLFGAIMMMTNTQFSFLLAEIGISSPALVSQTVVSTIIVSACAAFLYGKIRQAIGAHWCFPLILLCWCIGLTLLGFAQTMGAAALGAAIAGISAGLFPAHMATTLSERADPGIRNRAIALMYSAIYLGDFLNPFLIEPLSVGLSRHGAFLAVGLFCGATFLTLLPRSVGRLSLGDK